MSAPPPDAVDGAPPEPSLIDFPCDFPLKVMGEQVDGFEAAMVALVRRFDPGFDAATVERRPSRGGRYVGLTLTVKATDRGQLDDLYRALSSHPMVRLAL